MAVRFGAVPFKGGNDQWWYHHTNPFTEEVRVKGPFDTRLEALDSIAADAAQTEHAMPISTRLIGGGEPKDSRSAEEIQQSALSALEAATPNGPNWRQARLTITDQVDQLLDSFHPADTTYSVTFTAEIDADTGSSTMREEISLAELQAFRAILALRPR
jgi:hypothetical protein